MTDAPLYALLLDPRRKPMVFPSLDALIRRLRRDAWGCVLAFDATPSVLVLPGERQGRFFVKVHAYRAGQLYRSLGYAYAGNDPRTPAILRDAVDGADGDRRAA